MDITNMGIYYLIGFRPSYKSGTKLILLCATKYPRVYKDLQSLIPEVNLVTGICKIDSVCANKDELVLYAKVNGKYFTNASIVSNIAVDIANTRSMEWNDQSDIGDRATNNFKLEEERTNVVVKFFNNSINEVGLVQYIGTNVTTIRRMLDGANLMQYVRSNWKSSIGVPLSIGTKKMILVYASYPIKGATTILPVCLLTRNMEHLKYGISRAISKVLPENATLEFRQTRLFEKVKRANYGLYIVKYLIYSPTDNVIDTVAVYGAAERKSWEGTDKERAVLLEKTSSNKFMTADKHKELMGLYGAELREFVMKSNSIDVTYFPEKSGVNVRDEVTRSLVEECVMGITVESTKKLVPK
jgi:hypothetical protein